MKIDFHVHTEYSNDGKIKIRDLVNFLQKNNCKVDALAITDHNTIEGALELNSILPNKIILGEEIDTGEGEVIGYWLKSNIKKHLGLKDTIDLIKNQGGVVCIPHPFDILRKKRIKLNKIEEALKNGCNLMEVFNSRNLFDKSNLDAVKFAKENNLLFIAGSDAHYLPEVGNAYSICKEIGNINDTREVLLAITNAYKGKTSSFVYHIMTKMLKIMNKYRNI